MSIKKETKSNWENVSQFMQNNNKEITLGKYISYWFLNSPRRTLHYLSYYKFASKMIGKNKNVLDVGSNEGLGTWLLAKECGFAKGLDFDSDAIDSAINNFGYLKNIEFQNEDIFKYSDKNKWDAVVSFDVIEHILPENSDAFLSKICSLISNEGIFIVGTPSLISQNFASDISKKGHVNVYSPERLEEQMKKYFDFVFMFSAHDEVVHTGYLPLAHYLIALCCKKK